MLKKITIPISQEFKYLSQDNKDINDEIITYGERLYELKNKVLLETIKDKEVAKLKEEIEELKLIKKQIQVQLEDSTTQNKYIFEKGYSVGKDSGIEANNEIKEELKNRIIDLQDRIKKLEKEKEELKDLNTTINSFVSRFNQGNTEKGIFGELIVEDYLTDKFSTAMILNVSKETGQSDIRFNLDKLKLLIEVKNMKQMKSSSIQKFWNDIENNVKTGTINAAMFISHTNCEIFNGKRDFIFDYRNNIPVIYLSNVVNKIDHIKIGILVLKYLVENEVNKISNITNDDKLHLIGESIQNIYNNYKMSVNLLDKDRKIVKQLQEQIDERETKFLDIESIFNKITTKLPELHLNEPLNNLRLVNKQAQKQDKLDREKIELFNKIKEVDYNITRELLLSWNVKDTLIRQFKGGIKTIKNECKEYFRRLENFEEKKTKSYDNSESSVSNSLSEERYNNLMKELGY